MNSPPKATGKNQTKTKRRKKGSGGLTRKFKGQDKNIKRPKSAPNVGIGTEKEDDSSSHKRSRDDDEAETIGGACEKRRRKCRVIREQSLHLNTAGVSDTEEEYFSDDDLIDEDYNPDMLSA